METNTIYEKEDTLSKLEENFASLKEYVKTAAGHTEIHVTEKEIFKRLQEIGLLLVQEFVQNCGTGYQTGVSVPCEEGKPLPYKGTCTCDYFSIFGEIQIPRARYLRPSGNYHYPLDQQLNLPQVKYSYLLQKWIQGRAVETDYREAVDRLNEMFDFSLCASVPQRLGKQLGEEAQTFYENSAAPAPATEGPCLAISADGKGVRIVRSERSNSSSSTEAKARRGKGEKPGLKKEAVVTVDFTFHPGRREPEEIVNALMHQTPAAKQLELEPANPTPAPKVRVALNKHQNATLQGKKEAMTYLMERIHKRDPEGKKPLIVLFDGDPNWEIVLNKVLTAYGYHARVDAMILDIIHVSEYVWDVATALHGELSSERIAWVKDKLLLILSGNVGRVIGGLRQMLTKSSLSSAAKNAIKKAVTYFDNHRHMMNYGEYLAKGYPISTGLVEAACGSLVKDRMEQSGMRWSIQGAQAILRQRAVMKNGDWQSFWTTYIANQRKILYADGYCKAA